MSTDVLAQSRPQVPRMLPARTDKAGRPAKPRLAGRDHAIIEMAPDAIVVIDASGRIRLVNRQTEVLFGYAREQLLGQPMEVLIPERFHSAHLLHRAAYAAAPRAHPIGTGLQLFGRRQHGSEFPVEVSLAPLQEDGEPLVIASIRQVSEMQRVQAANRELRRLLALTDTALAHLELDDLLPALLQRVRDVMEVDNVAILLMDAEGQELLVRAAQGLEEAVAAGVRVSVGQGFAGRIAASRQPLIVEDLSTFPVASPILRERLHSAVGVPLVLDDRVLGVLHIGTTEPHQFNERDVQLLQRVAEHIAVAVERAHLYAGVQAAHAAEQQARRDAEAALARAQASEARLRRLVEAGIIGIAVGDAHHVVEANDALLQMLGYTRDDLLAGHIPWEQWPSEEEPATAGADAWALRELLARGACTPYEREVIRHDGSRLTVVFAITLLSQEPLEWVCFAVDISDRKRLERERAEARANEAAARDISRHLDESFRTASHDIRNPLTVAQGHAALALARFEQVAGRLQTRGGPQAEQARRILDSLQRTVWATERLASLNERLFDVVRARAGALTIELAPVELRGLVRDQVEAQRVATPGRSICLGVPDEGQPVWVQADAIRLGEVLTNYLTNALKYSGTDKPVEVRLEVVEQWAVVSVVDEGPGLPREEQSRVWEMLHRAPGVQVQSGSGAQDSLGMGLYVCKHLIELHPGGQVGVESVAGHGSTFWFRLPVASAPDAA